MRCFFFFRNTSGYSPLHLSCHNTDNYDFHIVREIVRHGYNTDVNQPNTEPFTTCSATHINYTTGEAYFFYLVGLHYPPLFDFGNSKKKRTNLKWQPNLDNIVHHYWTLSCIMCLKSYQILEIKNCFDRIMNNWYILEQSFILFFFSDHRTLKFLEMKCNPTNKKV